MDSWPRPSMGYVCHKKIIPEMVIGCTFIHASHFNPGEYKGAIFAETVETFHIYYHSICKALCNWDKSVLIVFAMSKNPPKRAEFHAL
jgi:hypothetical protein